MLAKLLISLPIIVYFPLHWRIVLIKRQDNIKLQYSQTVSVKANYAGENASGTFAYTLQSTTILCPLSAHVRAFRNSCFLPFSQPNADAKTSSLVSESRVVLC